MKTSVSEIKSVKFVVDDDELSLELTSHSGKENMLLGVVLPSYDGFGKEDESGIRSFLQFFVMEKVDYKTFKTQEEYIDVFQRTLLVARKMITYFFGVNGENCLSMDLDYNSLKVYPISKKSQCNGYVVEIDEEKYQDF
ncbi:hypothetical protein OEA66_12110 [Chryseobacterium sp. KC 927]|uniref:Uncharacterized protein n=2 Tax=Chryseobacterium luquanense TaxID=2983766 RepID=A0ABT3Y4L6_9FLAO|nr:hypothetical protein [Chryseobacterium luquanense]